MTATYMIFSAVLAVALLVTVLAVVVHRVGRLRAERVGALLQRRYMRIVTMMMTDGRHAGSRFPMIGRPGAKEVLARVLVLVASSSYGADRALLERLVAENGVDRWLLRRVRLTGGYTRARYLSLIASLPVGPHVVKRVSRYAQSRNRYVRFYTLMVRVVSDPSQALKTMAGYREPFTGFEVAEIMAMLRRGLFPVAYGPLLESPVRNLRVIGLNIVRQFGIEEAERALLRMVGNDPVSELCHEAIYTLASMHLPITRREIVRRVWSMDRGERKALCRRLAREGYSVAALGRLFDNDETRYVDSLVSSYKRSIACN